MLDHRNLGLGGHQAAPYLAVDAILGKRSQVAFTSNCDSVIAHGCLVQSQASSDTVALKGTSDLVQVLLDGTSDSP